MNSGDMKVWEGRIARLQEELDEKTSYGIRKFQENAELKDRCYRLEKALDELTEAHRQLLRQIGQ